MIQANGIACDCGAEFERFSTWEDHREGCEEYE